MTKERYLAFATFILGANITLLDLWLDGAINGANISGTIVHIASILMLALIIQSAIAWIRDSRE